MIAQGLVSLNDTRAFQPVPGLWTGKKGPLVRVKVLRSTDFCGDGRLDYTDVADVDVEGRQLAERQLTQGDIVVERSGGGPNQPVGRVAIFEPATSDNYCCGNFTTSIRVVDRQRFDPAFVAFYLHYWHMIGETQRLQNATTGIRNLDWSKYLEIEIPQPELLVQLEIVRVLDFARSAYVGEDSLCNLLRLGKASIMERLFTRGLRGEAQKELQFGSVPESWRERPLDSVSEVQTGAAKGRKFADGDAIDVPYLRVANVQDGHLDLREMKTLRIRKSEVERYRLRNNDVVLTEGGDFDKLGRGFIWRDELPLCVHQNHVFAVRTNREALLPEFFAYLAQSPYGKAYFLQVAHKTTNLACINSTKLKAFPVVLPEPPEQRQIAEILDAIDQKIQIHKKKRSVLDALFRALLHKLMTGEIRVSDLGLSVLDGLRPTEVPA